MRKRFLFTVVLTAFILSSCRFSAPKRSDLLRQSRYWINWKGDQSNYATPANIWRGFIAAEGCLVAGNSNPVIAFFLKEPAAREYVHIVYRCAVPQKIQVFVNEQFAVTLPSSPKFSRHSFSCTWLRNGFNQIRFAWADKSFHLRALYLQKKNSRFASQDLHELKEAEGFEVYLSPGRVDFEFQGQASLHARCFGIVDDHKLSAPISQTISVAKKKTIFSYSSPIPFVASISCLQGSAAIYHLWYHAAETTKREPQGSAALPAIDRRKIKDIFIFLLDACQANHLRLYGYSRDTAQRISEFAKDSLVFKQAFSNASYTAAAVGSIFTGLYPDHHLVLSATHVLNKQTLTLPLFLKNRGYATAVFTANAHVSNRSGLVRGVDHYKQFLDVYRFGQSHKLVDAFGDWIKASSSPSFSYLHFMEPHFPIVPPPPFLNQYKKKITQKQDLVIRHITQGDKSYSPEEVQDVIDDYDSCINYVDSLFGQAIATLKKNKRYDDSLIILLADHGEGCYEHGAWGHGDNVYAEVTHVPLVIKFPKSCGLKGEIGSLVQTGALFPTLYEILSGQDGPFDISSFSSILSGRQSRNGGLVVTQGFSGHQLYAVVWNQWYYINCLERNQEDLYNLFDEPYRSRIQSQPDLASFLRLRFLEWLRMIQTKVTRSTEADLSSLSREELDQFKSLGYL